MAENRRRQIIKRIDGGYDDPANPLEFEGEEEEFDLFAPPQEGLLNRTVYIPVPMIIGGFLAVILLSFSITYLAWIWSTSDLDLPANPRLAEFQDSTSATTLALRQPSGASPTEAVFPEADVEILGFRQAIPLGMTENLVTAENTFKLQRGNATTAPVANLKALQQRGPLPENITDIPVPPVRQNFVTRLTKAPSAYPETNVTGASFRQAFDIPVAQTLPQSLLPRRFAKGVTIPVSDSEVDPLIIPATGEGLPTRTAQFETPERAGLPVSELGGLGEGPIEGIITPNQVSPQTPGGPTTGARAVSPPVANLILSPETSVQIFPANQPQSMRLLAKRFAKGASYPEADENTNPLAIPLEGGAIPERERTFSQALGLQDPAANLVLNPNADPLALAQADVPGYRLMPRRYAKATIIPDRLEVSSDQGISQPEAPAFEGDIFTDNENLEPWQRYAAAVPPGVAGKPRIVIIIDDMGNNSTMARRLSELKGPINFAFLPYAPNLAAQTKTMRAAGHELLVHMPMEPEGDENPGPRALTTNLNDAELKATLDWNLSQFEGFVGVNNHMGSRFTTDQRRMDIVMRALKERGLLFLDSVTTSDSKGVILANRYDIPWAGRDVFLDNEVDEAAILAQLKKVEDLAKRKGLAIAIGHPHPETYRALKTWIPTLAAKGVVLVPLSSVVKTRIPRKLAGGGG